MFQKKNLKNDYPLILIGLYPLALILGTFIAELITFILITLFLYKSYYLKNWKWTKEIIFYFLIATYLYLIINSILSNFPLESNQRAIFFIRFILKSFFFSSSK